MRLSAQQRRIFSESDYFEQLECCGIREYVGINRIDWRPFRFINTLAGNISTSWSFAQVIVVHAVNPSQEHHLTPSGRSRKLLQLKNLLHEMDVGKFVMLPSVRNPNTGNRLHTGILTLHPRWGDTVRAAVKGPNGQLAPTWVYNFKHTGVTKS